MKYNNNQIIINSSHHPQHKLNLNYTDIPFKCNGCKETGIGSHYNCSFASCDYDLHTHCATPKPSISHPFYTECTFQFLSHPPGPIQRYCNACQKPVSGFLYHCPKCGFDLHPCCARLPMVLQDVDGKLKLNLFEKVSSGYCCQSCGRKGRLGWSYININNNNKSAGPGCSSSSSSNYSLHVGCVKEMINVEYQRRLSNLHHNELLVFRIPSFNDILLQINSNYESDDHTYKKAGGKTKNLKYMLGMALQFIVSAILGDPTALLAGVVGTLISKS